MNMRIAKFQRAVVHIFVIVIGATGLKDLNIKVPSMVRSGDSALLSCNYELGESPLYMIKWYFEEVEFYRFVPNNTVAARSFDVRNIKIDFSKSNMQDVTLVNVTRDLSGVYKCEVSEDYPTYETKIGAAPMLVVDVPEIEPTIEDEKQRLPSGEILTANCTSGASRPAPNITWTLNGLHLKNSTILYKVQFWNSRSNHEKNRTHSNLQVKITNDLFQGGRFRLRCFASIGQVYNASAELEIAEDEPLLASITGDASPQSHQTSGCHRLSTVALVFTTVSTMVFLNFFCVTPSR